jgi:acetyl-CoA acetyltransferase
MVSNYCATGTDAFRCGVMAVAAGLYDTVLVVGYDKPKDRGVSGPSVMMNRVRDLPQTPAGWFALCAAPTSTVRRRPRGPGAASRSRTTTTARWRRSRS